MTAYSPDALTPAQLLFPDLAQEFAATRRALERVPEAHAEWKPHGRSTSLGALAAHVAELPVLATMVATTDEVDFATGKYQPLKFESTAQVLAVFDERAEQMRQAVDAMTWEQLGQRWVMRAGEQVFVDNLKGPLLRSFGLSHLVHHRAQLGVYLRLLDVAVPKSYGPTADER
jgi:uncharacterized damage-inducible protein DinB